MSEAGPTLNLFWFLLGLFVVAAFAWTRPLTLTDFENRRLARNMSAHVFFTLLYVVLYVVLVIAFQSGGKAFWALVESVNVLSVFKYVLHKSDNSSSFGPLLALAAIGWFQSLQVLREVERTCLVYTYSARYMFSDVKDLTEHFQNCAFDPSQEERSRNLKVLERLNVFLTDSNTAQIDAKMVTDWRKVETLLRHLDAWTAHGKLVLNDAERTQLEDVATAHHRKTELAISIIRMLDQMASGRGDQEIVEEVTDLLARARSGRDRQLDAVEARIESALEAAKAPNAQQPIYLSNQQAMTFVARIQGYFEEEYRILLRQVSELAAKSIVHSGDLATDRLRTVKGAGFKGLGRILPISFNRILWTFFAVLAASFVMFVARQWLTSGWAAGSEKLEMQRTLMMAGSISLTMALAAIVGAAVASTRQFAQAPSVPWRAYVSAGLIAVMLFFITHSVRIMLMKAMDRQSAVAAGQLFPPQPQTAPAATVAGAKGAVHTFVQTPSLPANAPAGAGAASGATSTRSGPLVRQQSLMQSAPWALVPFVMTLSLCLLARMSGWPLLGPSLKPGAAARPGSAPAASPDPAGGIEPMTHTQDRRWTAVLERCADGFALGLAMIGAIVVVLKIMFPLLGGLFPGAGIQLPPRMLEAMQQTWLPPSIVILQFSIGFFIGALIVRDLRRAAHARVVLIPADAPRSNAASSVGVPAGRLPVPLPTPAT